MCDLYKASASSDWRGDGFTIPDTRRPWKTDVCLPLCELGQKCTDPRGLRLYTDPAAKPDANVRVALPDDCFLHVVLNGAHRDHLLYSGLAIMEGMPEGTVVYFPPATVVNPGDARDGPLIVIKTPEAELAIMRETEGALHLDLGVKLSARFEEMQGVLGQTLEWARDGSGPAHVKDGALAGVGDGAFEVTGGLMGHAFPRGLYEPPLQPPAATAAHARATLTEAGGAVWPPAGARAPRLIITRVIGRWTFLPEVFLRSTSPCRCCCCCWR
ncbi:MAG: hypothetical protein J3K34DRAFT_515740 [Monoraphidium minutum]|nr:MAG: hypothetical protein J3K34DRAFT_515740 [Monoraphidium minutum]